MIKNGFYYPDWIWKNKIHKNETTLKYEGSSALCFAVGNRKAGKSVGIGIFALADFLCYGYKTVLMRRFIKNFEDSKKPAMENFWNKSLPFISEFPKIVRADSNLLKLYPESVLDSVDWDNVKIEYKGHTAFINDVLFSYPVAINMFSDFKNNNFDDVHTIIYDEFVAEDGNKLSGEVTAVYNLYDTIARGRDDALKTTSIIFISNAITFANDFFTELGIDRLIRKDTKRLLRKDRAWCLEIIYNEIVADTMKTSAIGKAMMSGDAGKAYLGYSQNNTTKDNSDFIVPSIKGNSRPTFNIRFQNRVFSFEFFDLEGVYFMTDEHTNNTITIALLKEDQGKNTILNTLSTSNVLKNYKTFYSFGKMRFNSQRTKNAFIEMYKYL